MKEYDDVRVIRDDPTYEAEGVRKGMVGYIVLPEIRENSFLINFIDKNFELHREDNEWFRLHFDELKDDIMCPIKICDLEMVKDNGLSDEDLLDDLPKHNPKWWCKVEDGYILNLLGEKKNKIPYDFDS